MTLTMKIISLIFAGILLSGCGEDKVESIGGYVVHRHISNFNGVKTEQRVLSKKFTTFDSRDAWNARLNELMNGLGARKILDIDDEIEWISVYVQGMNVIIARINRPGAESAPGYQVALARSGKNNLSSMPDDYAGSSEGVSQSEIIYWYPFQEGGVNELTIKRASGKIGNVDFINAKVIFQQEIIL